MKWTREEQELMRRHYQVINIFGFEFWWFSTSPKKVLDHLKEIESPIKAKKNNIIKFNFGK
jgi:hypothetical protein